MSNSPYNTFALNIAVKTNDLLKQFYKIPRICNKILTVVGCIVVKNIFSVLFSYNCLGVV